MRRKEDVALTSAGKQEKRKKKDLSKVKCFHCGELGHYVSQSLKKQRMRSRKGSAVFGSTGTLPSSTAALFGYIAADVL